MQGGGANELSPLGKKHEKSGGATQKEAEKSAQMKSVESQTPLERQCQNERQKKAQKEAGNWYKKKGLRPKKSKKSKKDGEKSAKRGKKKHKTGQRKWIKHGKP